MDDITAQRQIEVQLELEMILESIGDFFFALDRDWRLVYLNPRMEEAIHKERNGDASRGEVVGQSFWEVFPELVGTRCEVEFHRALREQRMVGFETQGPLSGMWSELRVYPSASGVSVYSRDISRRKDAEQRVLQAQEVERSRIARALHDDALQGLGDAIALALAADRAAMGSPATRQLVGVLQGVGERLRGAIYGLRLAAEERTPFAELVQQLVDEHQAIMMADTPIELARGDGIPEDSLGDRGLEVLRVIGEALTNARRHAHARHVRVRVWGANVVLWAEVSDDGRGFDLTSPASPLHHGISGMHERARLVGGRLEVHSEPDGGGTTVRLQMSLADDGAHEV